MVVHVWHGCSDSGFGPVDLVIVPGARVRPDGSASPALRRRLTAGVAAQQTYGCPLLLSGRGSGPVPEATVMREMALELGVDADDLLVETHSMTTAENARYCYDVAPAQRICIVTDSTHMARCRRVFSEFYPTIVTRPVAMPLRATARTLIRESVVMTWRYGLRP